MHTNHNNNNYKNNYNNNNNNTLLIINNCRARDRSSAILYYDMLCYAISYYNM